MRIVMLTTHSVESPGMVGRFLPLARELQRQGNDVQILALYHDLTGWNGIPFLAEGVPVRYVGSMQVRKTGNVKSYYSPLLLVWVVLRATLGFVLALWRMPCDVIQICKPHPQNSAAGWLVGRLRGIPIFVDCDDYEAVNNRFSGMWQQRITALVEDWIIRASDGVTAGNAFIGERSARLRGDTDRVVVVHNAVDRARFSGLDSPESLARQEELNLLHFGDTPRRALFVGTVSLTSHGLDILIEAWRRVVQHLPDSVLLIVGGGEDFDLLRTRAETIGDGKRVRFAGRAVAADIPHYFRIAQLSCDPMHRSLPAESSLSLKLVESLVAGTPCVTADIGDRAEVVSDAGLAVSPDDAIVLADALLLLLSQPALLDALRSRTGPVSRGFFWDVKAPLFLQLYGRS